MKDEARSWLRYALDDLQAAKTLLGAGLLNPCLQNCQQSVEKSLKAIIVYKNLEFRKTHNILELTNILRAAEIQVEIESEECMLIDSIYIPSKYPAWSAIPDSEPDRTVCERCVSIAERVFSSVERLLIGLIGSK